MLFSRLAAAQVDQPRRELDLLMSESSNQATSIGISFLALAMSACNQDHRLPISPLIGDHTRH